MSKKPLETPPDIAAIDCPRCGTKGYVFRQSRSTENKAAVRVYLCSECGERTEIFA